MGKPTEISRLKSLVRRYRRLTGRMISESEDYTGGEDCPLCSGYHDYLSARDNEKTGEVRHSRRCPTRQAEKLEAVKI